MRLQDLYLVSRQRSDSRILKLDDDPPAWLVVGSFEATIRLADTETARYFVGSGLQGAGFEATIRLADTETSYCARSTTTSLRFEATIRLADTETTRKHSAPS